MLLERWPMSDLYPDFAKIITTDDEEIIPCALRL